MNQVNNNNNDTNNTKTIFRTSGGKEIQVTFTHLCKTSLESVLNERVKDIISKINK